MTEKDLRLQFKNETGYWPDHVLRFDYESQGMNQTFADPEDKSEYEFKDYTLWLEEKLLLLIPNI